MSATDFVNALLEQTGSPEVDPHMRSLIAEKYMDLAEKTRDIYIRKNEIPGDVLYFMNWYTNTVLRSAYSAAHIQVVLKFTVNSLRK